MILLNTPGVSTGFIFIKTIPLSAQPIGLTHCIVAERNLYNPV